MHATYEFTSLMAELSHAPTSGHITALEAVHCSQNSAGKMHLSQNPNMQPKPQLQDMMQRTHL